MLAQMACRALTGMVRSQETEAFMLPYVANEEQN